MRIGDAFPSKYIKANDLDGDTTVTIEGWDTEERRDGSPQHVLRFVEFPKKVWGLNKTNGNSIAKVLGDDEIENWNGKRITLYATEVQYGDETMMGIRVRLTAPTNPNELLGDKAAKVLAAKIAELDKTTPGNLDTLRVVLAGKHPEFTAQVAEDPAKWPRSLAAEIKTWLDNESVPF